MNILILGDSWGFSNPEREDATGHTIENTLFLAGHTVFNKSIFGGTNLHTLGCGLSFLKFTKHLLKIDLIIWLNTELGRDFGNIEFNNDKNYIECLDSIHNLTLNTVLEIKSVSPNSKWAIIGGHTALYKENDYKWADFLVPDWKSEILGIKMPDCQYMGDHKWLFDNRYVLGLDYLEKETAAYNEILKIQSQNKHIFGDGVHVNNQLNSMMANRILKWMNKYE